jgi:hypothetical protein
MPDEKRNPVTTGRIDRLSFRGIADQRIKFRMQTDSSSTVSRSSFAPLLSFSQTASPKNFAITEVEFLRLLLVY